MKMSARSMYVRVLVLLSLWSVTTTWGNEDLKYGDIIINRESGLLSIYYSDSTNELQFLPFCFEQFNEAAGIAACHQLGYIFDKKGDTTIPTNQSVAATCPVVSNYSLYGEYHILRCQHAITHSSCNKVALSCKNSPLPSYEGQVKLQLVDGTSRYNSHSSGVAMLHHKPFTYPICIDGLSRSTINFIGASICRQLGYTELTDYEDSECNQLCWKIKLDNTCTNKSLSCFSHCFSTRNVLHTETCHNTLLMHCAFNGTKAIAESSGSPGRCTITATNNASSAFTIATWALTGTLSAILLVLLCVCMSCYCYGKCRHKKLRFVDVEVRARGGSIWDWLHLNRRAEYDNLPNDRRNDE